MLRFSFLSASFFILLSGCSGVEPPAPAAVYTPVSFSALGGWQTDSVSEARPALLASCQRLAALPAERSLGADGKMGKAGDWAGFCAALPATQTSAELCTLFEAQLQPYSVSAGGNTGGLFTGYYESELRGSLTQNGKYQTPLYTRPSDLVMLELGDFRPELKGQRLAGRVQNGQLKPYEDRSRIVGGALAGKVPELLWLDDAVDAFFVQVQGSGRVMLDDGGEMRIGYDGQNGHPYTAIGKTLITKGALTSETVSMQSIRSWLNANPAQANAVMNSNASYVFFRQQAGNGGPLGAANVALTEGRSLAVDNRYVGYHVPVWLELANLPPMAPGSEGAGLGSTNRLMVAQDTGGAIRGIVRGDVFWGHGPQAEAAAGAMKSQGRYFVFLPKHLPKP